MTHPLPYIEELADLPEINSLKDIIRIRDFVYHLIPWGPDPFTENAKSVGIQTLYEGFKSKKLHGWCGLNAEFFRLIIDKYQVKCWSFNYGLENYKLTHAGAVVDLTGRYGRTELNSCQFYMDPYFAKHYTFSYEFPLTFDQLIEFIHKRKEQYIKPSYSSLRKPVWDVQEQNYKMLGPEEFESVVMDFYRKRLDYDSIMNKVFQNTNPLLLMLLKI